MNPVKMIGHELGHVTGTRADEEWAEENRADEFGDVAAQAYRVLMQRPLFQTVDTGLIL